MRVVLVAALMLLAGCAQTFKLSPDGPGHIVTGQVRDVGNGRAHFSVTLNHLHFAGDAALPPSGSGAAILHALNRGANDNLNCSFDFSRNGKHLKGSGHCMLNGSIRYELVFL